jgi:hypothetical protein
MPPAGRTRNLWQRSARQQDDDGRRRNRNQPIGQGRRTRRRRRPRQERRGRTRRLPGRSLAKNQKRRRLRPARRPFRQLRQQRCPNRSGIQPAGRSALLETRRHTRSRQISVRLFARRHPGPGQIASRDEVDVTELKARPTRTPRRSSPQQTTSRRTRCSTSRSRRFPAWERS